MCKKLQLFLMRRFRILMTRIILRSAIFALLNKKNHLDLRYIPIKSFNMLMAHGKTTNYPSSFVINGGVMYLEGERIKPKKYAVQLKTDERKFLEEMTKRGNHPAAIIKRANILLNLDENHGSVKQQSEITEQLSASIATIYMVSKPI